MSDVKTTAANVRYWIEHNTWGMNEHDLNVLRTCLEVLDAKVKLDADLRALAEGPRYEWGSIWRRP
jgi:hypothetical protein